MNIDEAAAFLRVTRRALERWVVQGLLGADVLRGSAHDPDAFDPVALELWACGRGLVPAEGPGSVNAPFGDLFAQSVERGVVSVAETADSARTAIEIAMAALPGFSDEERAELVAKTLERERLMATGMGHGIAVPHPRKPPRELVGAQVMSVLYLPGPVDWAAPDGIGVHTVLLQLSPSTQLHLQLLSRISTALRTPGFGEFLAARPEKEQLLDRLREIHAMT